MPCWWLSIEVRLTESLALVDEDGTSKRAELRGFVQELACTADDEDEAKSAVRAHIARYDLGASKPAEVNFLEVEAIDPASIELDAEDRLLQPIDARGVWFATARSFWSEDDR